MNIKVFIRAVLLGFTLGFFCVSAQALPMTGGVSFVGFGGGPFVPGAGTTDATAFDFPDTGNAFATSVTGDFVGLIDIFTGPGDTADLFTFHDFTFDPLLADTLVWDSTDVDIAFYLDSVTVTRGTDVLALDGAGRLVDTLTAEEIAGAWNITVNEKGGSFSWSSSTAVSEPGMFILLGLGVAGLGLSSRKNAATLQ